MSPVTFEVRDGKARYDDRTLAEWVPNLVDLVVGACSPEEVLLFGSVARGDDGPDSDLDLMVVCSSIDYTKRHELEAKLYGALSGALPVQVFVTDRRECERRRDVVGSMHYWPLREGRVVYARAAVDGRYADDLADADAELAESLAGLAEHVVAEVRRELGAERGRQ
ncbi:MAG: nucleotidyltransferase domain-containing protein [Acidimicrobiales bacterium]